MGSSARAALETLLRARRLDVTLTSAMAPVVNEPASTGIGVLDGLLNGGLPRGQLSELVGPRSSGRMTLLQACLTAATARGEIATLVDTFDSFDPVAGMGAGIDLTRMLWIRGYHPMGSPTSGSRRELVARFVDRAIKALGIVLHAGGFGLVALDLADVPGRAITQLPFTTWLRIGRAIEGSRTACLLVASDPIARSAGGVTVALQPGQAGGRWSGAGAVKVFRGLDIRAQIVSARLRTQAANGCVVRAE